MGEGRTQVRQRTISRVLQMISTVSTAVVRAPAATVPIPRACMTTDRPWFAAAGHPLPCAPF